MGRRMISRMLLLSRWLSSAFYHSASGVYRGCLGLRGQVPGGSGSGTGLAWSLVTPFPRGMNHLCRPGSGQDYCPVE